MEERVATIAEMVKRGYLGQLALSHDCCAWSDFFPMSRTTTGRCRATTTSTSITK